jgi:hypothetical protein
MLAPAADRQVPASHNNPPGPLASAKEAMTELKQYLADTPVIHSPQEAKQAGGWIERTRIALAEMENERTAKVAPLNQQLTAINGAYRLVREPFEKMLKEIRRRVTDYASAVEAARIAEANRLRAEAEEKERVAREAERQEQDSIAAVDVGECADVGAAIEQANETFHDYEKANRAAAVAERNVPVRIGSVMGGPSLSMRTIEVLVVGDACAAIKALGLTDKIRDAILSSAREFRKAHGELPAGVTSEYQRSL